MNFTDPATCNKSWVLSDENEKNPVSIPQSVFKCFGRQDVVVLNFLYRSYIKQLNGVILNEEEDLNPHLQVSSFLGALYNSSESKFLVLVLCPEDSIIKWHYYMSQCSKFELKIINPKSVPEDFDHEGGVILFLSFTNIKLADYLKEYRLFSVVIDNFDEVATKLVVRKLQGKFNIGITSRNFYVNPNQKLQWTMLNWANPGCVGKLADFYEIDNDNFANFRDNYKEWWFRLTWVFCESFVKPTLEDTGNLIRTLRHWGKAHNLTACYQKRSGRKPQNRKRKGKASIEVEEPVDKNENKRAKKVYKDTTTKSFNQIPYKNVPKKRKNNHVPSFSSDKSSSDETIIYGDDPLANLEDGEDNDEPPICALPKNVKVLEPQVEHQLQNNIYEESLVKGNDIDQSVDDNDSASSGEQLLCSLAGNKNKKLLKNTRAMVTKSHNESEESDESDLFLKSVATTSSGLSPLKNQQKVDKFFNKILKKSDDKSGLNFLTEMEMELNEKEVHDVPSESDGFFKGILRNDLGDKSTKKETENCSESSNYSFSNGHVDVDSLVAEVMEMVGKK